MRRHRYEGEKELQTMIDDDTAVLNYAAKEFAKSSEYPLAVGAGKHVHQESVFVCHPVAVRAGIKPIAVGAGKPWRQKGKHEDDTSGSVFPVAVGAGKPLQSKNVQLSEKVKGRRPEYPLAVGAGKPLWYAESDNCDT